MKTPLADAALDQLFRAARSYNRWSDEPVPPATLHALYELLKFGPTATNAAPARFVFVAGAEARAKLVACVDPGNRVKVGQAPVTAIVGMDEVFYDKIPQLFPHMPQAGEGLRADPAAARIAMLRNSSLQGAYLMLAARALGLDCGPMSGFDHAKVDEAFFAGTRIRSNFLCALGAGTGEHLRPRNPRLAFDEACRIV
jgi:3-hydroxypropanoate dehydrogenase